MTGTRIVFLGDSCFAVQFAPIVDAAVNAQCITLAASVERLVLRGVRDVVPTYNTVTIHFDPSAADVKTLSAEIARIAAAPTLQPLMQPRTIEIPVRYGGASGPDLGAVAAYAHCSEAEVVRLHTEQPYYVYMLGFLPGFAYMGSVNPRIAMPRLDTPRLKVAAGSVGIAGAQTGVYPCDSPGGWRIIGSTSAKLFDATRAEPFLLRAGDHVKFVSE